MDYSVTKVDEIKSVLGKHPIGIRNDGIWDKTHSFDDKLELSKYLNYMSQIGDAYKKGDLWFLVATDRTSSHNERSVDRVAEFNNKHAAAISSISAAKQTVPEKKEANKTIPMGSLQRRPGTSSFALALYKLRNEEFISSSELKEFSVVAISGFYTGINKLISLGYIDIDDSQKRNTRYRWSGKFKYPFNSVEADDDKLLNISIEDFLRKKYPERFEDKASDVQANNTDTVNDLKENASSDEHSKMRAILKAMDPNMALIILDFQISMYQSQVSVLKQIRNTLVV